MFMADNKMRSYLLEKVSQISVPVRRLITNQTAARVWRSVRQTNPPACQRQCRPMKACLSYIYFFGTLFSSRGVMGPWWYLIISSNGFLKNNGARFDGKDACYSSISKILLLTNIPDPKIAHPKISRPKTSSCRYNSQMIKFTGGILFVSANSSIICLS